MAANTWIRLGVLASGGNTWTLHLMQLIAAIRGENRVPRGKKEGQFPR